MLPRSPCLLVFDLDGTLVDSRIDLTNSVNAMLAHFSKPALPQDVIAGYIGDGALTLVRRSLAHVHLIAGEADPHDDAFVEAALDWFIAYYKIHKLDYTTVYPGVMESLTSMRQAHPRLVMAVLTNKPVMPSTMICRGLGLEPFFFANYGGNSFASKKPDPQGLLTLIEEAGTHAGRPISRQETVMIGDSHVDVATARNCGVAALGCSYGLSPETLAAARPDATVDHARDWPVILNLT